MILKFLLCMRMASQGEILAFFSGERFCEYSREFLLMASKQWVVTTVAHHNSSVCMKI